MSITTNGLHPIKPKSLSKHSVSAVYISGALGAATISVQHKNPDDTYSDYVDATALAIGVYEISHGYGVKLYLNVTGADGSTAIDVYSTGI